MEMDLSHAMPAWIVRPLRWQCGEARERSEPTWTPISQSQGAKRGGSGCFPGDFRHFSLGSWQRLRLKGRELMGFSGVF